MNEPETTANRLLRAELCAIAVEQINQTRESLFKELLLLKADPDIRVRDTAINALAELNGLLEIC